MKRQRENVFILTPAIASSPKGNMDEKDIILNKTAKSLDATIKSVLTDTQRNANLLRLAGFRSGALILMAIISKKEVLMKN
jgi:hypothetical protein